VTISERPEVSRPIRSPAAGYRGDAALSSVSVSEDGNEIRPLVKAAVAAALVDGSTGSGHRAGGLVGIMQAIKAAGAMKADIEVM